MGQLKKCKICGKLETEKSNSSTEVKALSVDHNHKTHKIRGLLCANCNRALGLFGDDLETLRSAIKYLEKYQ